MISVIRFVAPLLLLLMPGCAVVERAPPPDEPAEAQTVPPPAGGSIGGDEAPKIEITPIAPPTPVPAEPLRKKPDEAPAAAKPAAPPSLDLTALETRLKDTKAIGVFTKITLKNQVDDLLDRFRAYYQGRVKTSLAELRQPYESLILKVLALLQDGDPELARAIVASREAIWGILSDPEKFATL